MFANERRRLVDLAAKNRLPGVYGFLEYVDAGALRPMGQTLLICFGAPPPMWQDSQGGQALPIEQPTKFELVIG